jgi:hypothetical protein
MQAHILVVVAVTAGCASSSIGGHGRFTRSGYASEYGYQVGYRVGTKALLPDDWSLENTREYVTTYHLDGNQDGKVDSVFKDPSYTLRFEQPRVDGVIWVQSIPLDEGLRQKEPRVLMQTYLDELAGGHYELVKLNGTTPTIVEHRYAVTVVERGPVRLGDRDGYGVTVDLANLDQIRLDPRARLRRIQLVLVRAPEDRLTITMEGGQPVSSFKLPVLVVMAYSNLPEDFDKSLPAFHDLLARITIGGKAGFSSSLTPEAPSTAPTGTISP